MKKHTTGEASKLLGVSFITIKRWIYSGRIKAEKNDGGRWLIADEEIQRLNREMSGEPRENDKKILDLVSSKQVAYLRELQVFLEEEIPHDETYAALKRLAPSRLNTRYEWDNRWYFPKDKQWSDGLDPCV